ncbi:MAG: lamin tail domain-containing protein [Brevefilum sp.]|nr:lamin tail domain-containing protein [Brevefilum sp.]MDT8381813.1 lamin tail domain-containing protein [Brevefilum sp.]MDW7755573.1 lamin tail domain-containing protein [Brevefilum sp.]
MKNKSGLFAFILLNIILSAATMLLVMWLWDRSNPDPSTVTNDAFTNAAKEAALQTATASAFESTEIAAQSQDFVTEDLDVSILTIVAPGNLDLEYVEIRNQSEGAVDISGWQLRDEDENIFTFPTIILNNSGAIKILSQKGIDTVIELYWQSETPIWESGETAHLMDDHGNIIATYSIP